MHTMLRVTMSDVMAANDAITEGKLESVVKKVSELIKPESTFFYSDGGNRAAIFLFDMTDAAMIPQIAEPFFTELNAKVSDHSTLSEDIFNENNTPCLGLIFGFYESFSF